MAAATKPVAARPAEEACTASDVRGMRAALLGWYAAHRRDLPWRATRDPYSIWVSEIMLQQTRVAAVLEHYRLFLASFPTVQALAGAREGEGLARVGGAGLLPARAHAASRGEDGGGGVRRRDAAHRGRLARSAGGGRVHGSSRSQH